MDINKAFGLYIKERRTELGYSQRDVAKMLGVSQACYQRYETGQREITLSVLKAIAVVLGFKPDDFFKGV